MVIVHLSAKQRRIITPQKTETLGEVFKRFCAEFGYNESEYEFQAFHADDRVLLDMNLNANIVKEVQLIPKSNYSRRDSEDSCYSIIRDASPPPVTLRKDIVSNPPPATNNISVQQPKSVKRAAPKPPVTVNNSSCDRIFVTDDSIMPDIDIPPPPNFLPNPNEKSETLFKSVECSTEFTSPEPDEYHHSSDNERGTEDQGNHLSDTDNSFDSREDITAIDNENESNKAVTIVIKRDENAQISGSNSCSSVEDVDEDEHLLDPVRLTRDTPDAESHMKQPQEIVDKQTQKKPDETSDHGDILPIQSSQEMSVSLTDHKRLSNDSHQELPETNQSSLKHSDEEREEEHSAISKTLKLQESVVLNNRVDIESPQTSVAPSEQVPDSRNDWLESDCKSNQSEPNDSENLHSENNDEQSDNDLSFPDGLVVPIDQVIRAPTPKHYWEPPKQSKTLQFLSNSLNTVGTLDEKPAETKTPNSVDNQTPNSATPTPPTRTVKQVHVTVEEPPVDNSGRPTYRPRQAKKLFFTAG